MKTQSTADKTTMYNKDPIHCLADEQGNLFYWTVLSFFQNTLCLLFCQVYDTYMVKRISTPIDISTSFLKAVWVL